jgi:hypothetical protein
MMRLLLFAVAVLQLKTKLLHIRAAVKRSAR